MHLDVSKILTNCLFPAYKVLLSYDGTIRDLDDVLGMAWIYETDNNLCYIVVPDDKLVAKRLVDNNKIFMVEEITIFESYPGVPEEIREEFHKRMFEKCPKVHKRCCIAGENTVRETLAEVVSEWIKNTQWLPSNKSC